jgi:hypothetical protein
MKRRRTRVRLTAKDWKAIWDALAFAQPTLDKANPRMRRALSKIGVDGMACSSRGVTPVKVKR